MKCLNKINVGDVFFITNSNFQYSTIYDNYEDFELSEDSVVMRNDYRAGFLRG